MRFVVATIATSQRVENEAIFQWPIITQLPLKVIDERLSLAALR